MTLRAISSSWRYLYWQQRLPLCWAVHNFAVLAWWFESNLQSISDALDFKSFWKSESFKSACMSLLEIENLTGFFNHLCSTWTFILLPVRWNYFGSIPFSVIGKG